VPRQEAVHAAASAPAAARPAGSPAADAVPRLETAPRYEAPGKAPAKQRPAAPEAAAKAPAKPAAKPKPAQAEAAPAKKKKGGRNPDDRAKRLARVLVSDILWYNREKRDQALEEGTLMTALGDEIKKSWELYKEKVGADVANSTNHFKEALNEILADGQQVF